MFQRFLRQIVPDTDYSRRCPAIIGTNILQLLMDLTIEEYGHKAIHSNRLDSSWRLAFKCMQIQKREKSRDVSLGLIKCAERKSILLHSNKSTEIVGYIDSSSNTVSPCEVMCLCQNYLCLWRFHQCYLRIHQDNKIWLKSE